MSDKKIIFQFSDMKNRGAIIQVSLREDATVSEASEALSVELGVPKSDIKLYGQGKLLPETDRMKDYKLYTSITLMYTRQQPKVSTPDDKNDQNA
jgi:hypothetical protein